MTHDAASAGAQARHWQRAFLWLLALGVFFFASYTFTNWLADQRANVGFIVFEWERHIPFLAWTIVPYWSIDLFYAISLFVCATQRELDTHAKRLFSAQVIAVTCFAIFPLRNISTRPEIDGLYGLMFDALLSFDKPFNQAPALHIALLVILWVLYAKHLRRGRRWLLHGWFALIGVSVLTTYQHHFIDVPTGALLGWLCVWMFPDDDASLFSRTALTKDRRRRTLALRYGLGALIFAALAVLIKGWGWWLLWVSASLGLVSIIYLCLDAHAFGKRADGTMHAASWWLFAPYFLGAWLNSRWWTRNINAADRLTPEVWIGRIPSRENEVPPGITAIVDLCAELPCARTGMQYVNLPALDLVTMNAEELKRAASAIEQATKSGSVLVCCALGFSRSASAVAAWLMISGRVANVDEAVKAVSKVRSGIVLTARHKATLALIKPKRDASTSP